MTWQAPLPRIKFALQHQVGWEQLTQARADADFTLYEAVLEEAARFCEKETAPLSREGDIQGTKFANGVVQMPPSYKSAYHNYAAGGWVGLMVSEANGGQGLPALLNAAVMDMLYSNIAFALCPLLSQGAMEALAAHASDALKKAYLPKLADGTWTATMNLTEPQAGSDLGAIRTSARADEARDDGAYRIRGTKCFITYGEHDLTDNIIHLVLARSSDAPDKQGGKGLSLFLVPKILPDGSANDLACIGVEEKLGIHASPTCVMEFGANDGAVGWLVGAEHQGLACMFTMMNNARLQVGLQGVGIAERATQDAHAYAQERKQGASVLSKNNGAAVAIAEHPDVQRMLATMRALTDAARAICYENALAIDLARAQNNSDDNGGADLARVKEEFLTPISKAFAADCANEVASLGVQVFGGMGYVEETGAAQHMRDARILPIYEGTNGIQAADLVRRKLPMAAGEFLPTQLQEMRAVAEMCRGKNDAAFQTLAESLGEGVDNLEKSSDYLLQQLKAEPANAYAGATAYLRQWGLSLSGHYLAKAALASEGSNDDSRKPLAVFFAKHFLVQTESLRRSVQAGYDKLTAVA